MFVKGSPFLTLTEFLRALAKACLLLLVANFGLVWLDVNPVRQIILLNTWNLQEEGRARLVYPDDFENGQLPLEALLAAHMIGRPAADDEIRTVLLGESGIAGWGLADEETLAAQITARSIRTGGRWIVAYNLAYPQPSVVRDAITLDAALDHDIDLVLWFLTPSALDNAPDGTGSNRVFFDLNRDRLRGLVDRYPGVLSGWYTGQSSVVLPAEPGWQRYAGIRDQALLPIWFNSLFYPFYVPDTGKVERRLGNEPVPEDARYPFNHPGFATLPNATWRFMEAGCRAAGARGAVILFVNRPILIGESGTSTINYNALYSRALYDRYREALATYMESWGWWYIDLWDAIPAERYTDTPLHIDAEGNALMAAYLQAALETVDEQEPCQ